MPFLLSLSSLCSPNLSSSFLTPVPVCTPLPSPADLTATIYHALGVTPAQTLHDREGRPVSLTEGAPIVPLFA